MFLNHYHYNVYPILLSNLVFMRFMVLKYGLGSLANDKKVDERDINLYLLLYALNFF